MKNRGKAWGCSAALLCCCVPTLIADDSEALGDEWLEITAGYPASVSSLSVDAEGLDSLKAEAIIGKLKISFSDSDLIGKANVTLHASVDEPGHWPARHWGGYPMTLRGKDWTARPPV